MNPVEPVAKPLKKLSRIKLDMAYTHRFEAVVLHIMAILLMFIIGFAVFWLCRAFFETIVLGQHKHEIENTMDLNAGFQRAMAGIFVVLIGIELLETIRTYNTHRRFRLEVVLVVSAIAVARHIIQLDFHHVDGATLAGMGFLIIALVVGFYLLQKMPNGLSGENAGELPHDEPDTPEAPPKG